jgi:hypothetical protein
VRRSPAAAETALVSTLSQARARRYLKYRSGKLRQHPVEWCCFRITALSGMPTMAEYRSYFRDSDGKIRGTQILNCEDDTAAAVKLEILLAARENCTAAEVWAGRKPIHRAKREGKA